MATKKNPETEREKSLIPFALEQNPAPVSQTGQQVLTTLQDLTDQIMSAFFQVLPSNYVAQITGPYYTIQFQAIAETLARVQLATIESSLDDSIDFTRPEFLWQTIGSLVFPEIDPKEGPPRVNGDVSFRTFLKRMIELLLQGSTLSSQEQGLQAVTTAVIRILEKGAYQRDPNSAWKFPEQFELEVNVSDSSIWTDLDTGDLIQGGEGTGFPEDPFTLYHNAKIILRALKPGHVLYEYRHLFRDVFGTLFEDSMSWQLESYYYDDFRRFCTGVKEISGTEGETLTDRTLFSDPTVSFKSLLPGSTLSIMSGPNTYPTAGGNDSFTLGRHRVVEILRTPFGADAVARSYTTSPSNLSGSLIVKDGGEMQDLAQDWSNAVEGEIITLSTGPNAGRYRLETLLGPQGGPAGFVQPGSGITNIRVSPSLLRLETRPPQVTSGQSYTVEVERLGVRTPRPVVGEDVSDQFTV